MRKILNKYKKFKKSQESLYNFIIWCYGTIYNKIRLKFWCYILRSRPIAESFLTNKAKLRFEKKYKKELGKKYTYTIDKNSTIPKVIWWCWLQGEENAPELAKICLKSVRKNFPDYTINIVTMDNIKNYVKIPLSVYQKFNSGIISGAFFSDILRLNLLAEHGGIWIDSTVYCSGTETIEKIKNNDLFMYSNVVSTNSDIIKMSSWLIAASNSNMYIKEAASLINKYAERMYYLDDYFICHIILTILADKYDNILKKNIILNNTNPHMLAEVINDKFCREQYEEIIKCSSFHKLNRHIVLEDSNTYYAYIKNKMLS